MKKAIKNERINRRKGEWRLERERQRKWQKGRGAWLKRRWGGRLSPIPLIGWNNANNAACACLWLKHIKIANYEYSQSDAFIKIIVYCNYGHHPENSYWNWIYAICKQKQTCLPSLISHQLRLFTSKIIAIIFMGDERMRCMRRSWRFSIVSAVGVGG